jgi:RecB family exonuclease
MQECVEIARRIQDAARRGIPFDRIAVLLHAPSRYAPYLEEALARASIPAWFARGTVRPEPGGRALLALLNCAAENCCARRFAEYLSLAQVPDRACDDDVRPGAFVPPDPEFLPDSRERDFETAFTSIDPTPVVDPGARAPWRWERILVDAAVINRSQRWHTRLRGREEELKARRRELNEDDARLMSIDRALVDLGHLRSFALPVIDALADLPSSATWRDWLTHLRALVNLAIRDRTVVLAALAELEPMAPIDGITLNEVRIVLGDRMGRLETPPPRRRYGAVFIAPTALARGLEFDLTIVPGLAERVLPQKLTEDPLLPDAARLRLDPHLRVQNDRVAAERLALATAVGSARMSMAFSYPRLDMDQGRPRVPSFYALEILRAAEGELPGFDELARRAAGESRGRIGWPAPENPVNAIDEAEFDLALLDRVAGASPEELLGAAHYLLDANPHLGRALRGRARRWRHLWTRNDGLVEPTADERAALKPHQLASRSYSPTALQNFSSCPYRFFLQAILRLSPREEITAMEAIDPLTRGSLFHEVQFETLSALRAAAKLPVTRANLGSCYDTLETSLGIVAREFHQKLAPAIERVWIDGIDSIRADLREWMRRMAEDGSGYRPERFELSFGLQDREHVDPSSFADPVLLASGIRLRGSIDMVEQGPDGLRVTDHKTGKARVAKHAVIAGGKALQPVLYALATERLLNERVADGRLYYCTAAGGYEERLVPLDKEARDAVAVLAEVVGTALSIGFMPAAPDEGECDYCDYRLLCGPYEQRRVRYKRETSGAKARLADLERLRALR